jgi:hypothetical protein
MVRTCAGGGLFSILLESLDRVAGMLHVPFGLCSGEGPRGPISL